MSAVIDFVKSKLSWGSVFSVRGLYVVFGIFIFGYIIWIFFGNKVKTTITEYSSAFDQALEQFKKDNLIQFPDSVINSGNSNNNPVKVFTPKTFDNNNNSSRNIIDEDDTSIGTGSSSIINNNNINNAPVNSYLEYLKKSSQKPKQKLRYEDECHRILEELTGKTFYKNVRPPFLKNPITNKNLELDCYDGENIGLEYQGIQHYKYPNPYHRSQKEFEYQIQKDKWKFDRCEENDVFLIRVPYTVPFRKLKSYIQSRLDIFYGEKSNADRTECYT